jgi:hypothetical protein
MATNRDPTRAMLRERHAPQSPPKPQLDIPSPEKLDNRGLRRQTLYLPPEVHEHIREICHSRRISQQKFFREVFDDYFQREGTSWAELERKGKLKGNR